MFSLFRYFIIGTIVVGCITESPLSLTVCLAAPAASIVENLTQPDGTEFKAIQRGDEWQHWVETEDGYTVIRDNATGWWYYAEPDENQGARKSQYEVGKVKPEELNLKKGVKPKRREHHHLSPFQDNQQEH